MQPAVHKYLSVALLGLSLLAACSPGPGKETERIEALEATIQAMSAEQREERKEPATPTPTFPRFNVTLLGCDTSLDITHGMGEVTNAYVTVSNVGDVEVTNVCASLDASDVGGVHPDMTQCVQYLPPLNEVTLKLTADTEYEKDTSIGVVVTTNEGLREAVARGGCRRIDPDLLETIGRLLGIVQPF